MFKEIEEFDKLKEKLVEKVKSYVQDKSIPLEDRWEVFTKAHVGETEGWGIDFPTLNEIYGREVGWYDDFGKDRYAIVEMTDIIEAINEQVDFGDIDVSNKQMNALKEEILDEFIWSFINDW